LSRAVDVIPVQARRDWFRPAGRRVGHATGVTVAVILIVAGALVVAPGRTTDRDDDPPQRPAVVNPAPVAPATISPDAEPEEPKDNAAAAPPQDDASELSPAQQLLQSINEERQSRGRRSLVIDSDLERVALEHVQEMVQERRLFHTPNVVLAERVTNWSLLAESIGVGPDVPALMDAFLRSDVDRRNMLDPKFWHVGIGAADSGQRLWVALLFNDKSDPEAPLRSG
jgi:uncharacterized protein YkwD